MLLRFLMILFSLFQTDDGAGMCVPDVVAMITQGDAGQAAEALAMLWNDEKLLFDTVPELLPHIIDCPDEFDRNLFHKNRIETPQWRFFPIISYKANTVKASRREFVLVWLCVALREASLSPERDNIRKIMLNYLEKHVEYGSERYLWVFELYFWSVEDIEPDSDCSELLLFIDKELERHQDLSENDNLIFPLRRFIWSKVPPQKWDEWALKYKKYFTPDTMKDLQCVISMDKRQSLSEKKFKNMDRMPPEELFNSMDDPYRPRYTVNDSLSIEILAGTKEARKKNFKLILPILKQQTHLAGCKDFLFSYAAPLPSDASDIEKYQQDVVLDTIERIMEACPGHRSLDMLMRTVEIDGKIIENAYATERVKAILMKYSNNSNLYNDTLKKNEAELQLERILTE